MISNLIRSKLAMIGRNEMAMNAAAAAATRAIRVPVIARRTR
jgi:hypothetical protein